MGEDPSLGRKKAAEEFSGEEKKKFGRKATGRERQNRRESRVERNHRDSVQRTTLDHEERIAPALAFCSVELVVAVEIFQSESWDLGKSDRARLLGD